MSIPFPSLSREELADLVNSLRESAEQDLPRIEIGNVRRLTAGLVLKTTPIFRARVEVEALQFVAKHCPWIPVPRLHHYWEEDGWGKFVMDYVEGEMYGKAARRSLSTAQKETVMRTLAGYVDDLRRIPQPPPPPADGLPEQGWIGSPLGNAMWDPAVYIDPERPGNRTQTSYGPFANQRDFNAFKVGQYDKFGLSHAETKQKLDKMRSEMPDDHDIVFTHGDINIKNVLVRVTGAGPNDVKVTALLDWEQAGWRPVWWESLKWRWAAPSTKEWREFGLQYLGAGYQADVELEETLRRMSSP